MKRKFTIAVLLGCIVLCPLLFSACLQVFQQYIQYTVSERFKSEQLTTISIPATQMQWVEKGKEILVDGKMFDIKSYSEKDGNLIAIGVYDEKEAAVMELLNYFNDRQQSNFIIQLFLLAQIFVVAICVLLPEGLLIKPLRHFSFIHLQKTTPHPFRFYIPPRSFFLY